MSNLYFHVGIMVFGVFIAAFSQLLLKKAADKQYDSVLKQYLNIKVISAYGMLFISTAASLIAFRVVPLSFSPVGDAAGQIFTLALGAIVLKEKINAKKAAGLVIIVIGILLVAV